MEIYNTKEAMAILKISQVTLLNLLKSKRIKGVRLSESKKAKWIIPKTAIEDFLAGK